MDDQKFSKFRLPVVEEDSTQLKKNISLVFSSGLVSESSVKSTFGHTVKGKVWLFLFGTLIVCALLVGFFMYTEGIVKSTSMPVSGASSSMRPQLSPVPFQKKSTFEDIK